MTLVLLSLAMLCLLISLVFQIGVIRQCRREKKQTNREPDERPGKLFELACSFQQGALKGKIGFADLSGCVGLLRRFVGKHGEQSRVTIKRHGVGRAFRRGNFGRSPTNVSQQGRDFFVQVLLDKIRLALALPFLSFVRHWIARLSDRGLENPYRIGGNTNRCGNKDWGTAQHSCGDCGERQNQREETHAPQRADNSTGYTQLNEPPRAHEIAYMPIVNCLGSLFTLFKHSSIRVDYVPTFALWSALYWSVFV